MNDFGERLRRLRKDLDITQKQLADEIGVVPSAVGKYERLPDAYPSVEVLIKIADYFNVSLDYLLRGKKHQSSVENNISGLLSNSPFIQANNGDVVFNGDKNTENSVPLTPEAVELLRIYDQLNGRDRLKLLNYAMEVERSVSE